MRVIMQTSLGPCAQFTDDIMTFKYFVAISNFASNYVHAMHINFVPTRKVHVMLWYYVCT